MQRTDVIRLTDGRLQHHEHFGDSSRVVLRVSERYRFALEVLARRDARLREVATRVEALDAATAETVFGDLLVRAALETAISRLETSGADGAAGEELPGLLGEALDCVARTPGRCLSRSAMGR
ncbi:MAG: hypothetical protein EOO72_11345, partial [Myxococcaceae bacterium]